MSADDEFEDFLRIARDEGTLSAEDARRISSALQRQVSWNVPVPAAVEAGLTDGQMAGGETSAETDAASRAEDASQGWSGSTVASLLLKIVALAGLAGSVGAVVFVTTAAHGPSQGPVATSAPHAELEGSGAAVTPSAPSTPPSTVSVSDLPDIPVIARVTPPPSSAVATPRSQAAREPTSLGSAGSSPATLAEELAALDRVRARLPRSPEEALALRDAHARKYPATPFREEAALLRIEALVAAGRRKDAERVAEPFVRDREGAPVARHIKDLLAGSRTTDTR